MLFITSQRTFPGALATQRNKSFLCIELYSILSLCLLSCISRLFSEVYVVFFENSLFIRYSCIKNLCSICRVTVDNARFLRDLFFIYVSDAFHREQVLHPCLKSAAHDRQRPPEWPCSRWGANEPAMPGRVLPSVISDSCAGTKARVCLSRNEAGYVSPRTRRDVRRQTS